MFSKSGLINILAYLAIIILSSSTAEAQYPNIRINNPVNTDPEEVTIAINPVNPLNLAAGANLYYNYYSNDGGFTWNQGHMTSPYGVWGDPCVIYDAAGNLYYAHLSNPHSGGYWIDRIVVQKSTDGGISWNPGVGIWYNPPRRQQDKEWLASDMTNSTYRNNIYAAWTEFDSYGSTDPSDSSRILFSRSTDGGITWSIPVKVSDVGGNCIDSDSTVEGAVPAVGPNGEVYISWAGPLGIMFDKSTDGGQTFGVDKYVTSQPEGWDFNVSGIYRCNGMPVTACDAGNSPHRGNIYIQWSDKRNGSDNTDIFIIKSADGGQTWGPVIRVNDDATLREQFFPWMTIDQSTGYVYVDFYDRRNTSGDETDVYVARSTDGGETFSNFKVSEPAFTPSSDVFFGDYTNIAAFDGKIYPIWMRVDTGKLSVWTAIISDIMAVKVPISSGWNLVSVPAAVNDYRKALIFPAAISPAFRYKKGYQTADTLKKGEGYWLKFASGDTAVFQGSVVTRDSDDVAAGWNIIGSISTPLPVASIASLPPGLVTSGFFKYDGSNYVQADTLKPGLGYWVKVFESGKLLLSTSAAFTNAGRVRIVPDAELPPRPPELEAAAALPGKFDLSQNYPNPFNPATEISYALPKTAHVIIKVFNILGQEVSTLADGVQDAGYKSVWFDGGSLAGGIYFYRLSAGDFIRTMKMSCIK